MHGYFTWATPAQSHTGPVRACPWFPCSKVKWTLPIRPRLNPVRGPYGHARGLPERILPSGPHRNPVRDLSGHARTGPAQIPVCARSNPVIGPVRDLTGHSGQPRSNPIRAPAGASIWAWRSNRDGVMLTWRLYQDARLWCRKIPQCANDSLANNILAQPLGASDLRR